VPRSPPLKHTTDYTDSGRKQRTLIAIGKYPIGQTPFFQEIALKQVFMAFFKALPNHCVSQAKNML